VEQLPYLHRGTLQYFSASPPRILTDPFLAEIRMSPTPRLFVLI
jgi:hypothetical protein